MNTVRTSIEIENIKMKQSELKNTVTERKNTLQGVHIRLDDPGEWIRDLENSSGNHPIGTAKIKN